MSEKEERILIIPCRSECNCIRPVGNELYCGLIFMVTGSKIDPEKDCKNCKHAQYNGISRAEAIERMAHALCVKVHGPCDMCGNVKNGNEGHCNDYKSYAAAALDALMKDKNGK